MHQQPLPTNWSLCLRNINVCFIHVFMSVLPVYHACLLGRQKSIARVRSCCYATSCTVSRDLSLSWLLPASTCGPISSRVLLRRRTSVPRSRRDRSAPTALTNVRRLRSLPELRCRRCQVSKEPTPDVCVPMASPQWTC